MAGAPAWEESARNLRAGKVAYLKWQAAAHEQQVAANWGSVKGREAAERVHAFEKKDPNTVSEQELLRAAEDCDTVAREQRRVGGGANLANALTWERASHNLRAGKQAWALAQAQDAAARYNALMKRDPRYRFGARAGRSRQRSPQHSCVFPFPRWRGKPGECGELGTGRPHRERREGGVGAAGGCAGS